IGFELMLTPMLRNLDAARDKHVKILNRCGEWMEQKQLAVEVNRILELDQAVEAHRRIESGHTQGKIVLAI
ncbi:MAG: zinc-binding dehydrogenase, partial [Gammaproteobacteria bacterium]